MAETSNPVDTAREEDEIAPLDPRLRSALALPTALTETTTLIASLRGIAWTGQQPFLYFTAPASLEASADVIILGPGSLWLQAQYFAGNASATGYVGFQLLSGQIGFTSTTDLTPSPIIAPANVSPGIVTITCQLSVPSHPVSPDIVTSVPQNVTFSLSQTGTASLTSLDTSPSLTLYGSTVSLAGSPSQSVYNAMLSTIQFPFTAHPDTLAVRATAELTTLLTDPAVPVSVTAASWSLPITTIATGSGAASVDVQLAGTSAGSGGVSLQLGSGMRASFLGIPVDCIGPVFILADPATGLKIICIGSKLFGPGQKITLWNSSSYIMIESSKIGVTSGFAYSKLGGQESCAILGGAVISLDQPRNVNNERLYFTSTVVALLRNNGESASGVTLNVRGVTQRQSQGDRTATSYAMKNLLLTEYDPDNLEVDGLLNTIHDFSGVRLDGRLSLDAALIRVLPFLPDPYTTNIQLPTASAEEPARITKKISWYSTPDGSTNTTMDITMPNNLFQNMRFTVNPPPSTLSEDDRLNLESIDNVFSEATGTGRFQELLLGSGPMMLDLSTNISQFGVSFAPTSFKPVSSGSGSVGASVNDLFLQLPAQLVGVMTLPAVSWEPIVTDPTDDSVKTVPPFPNPLYFPDSGPTTVFGQRKTTMVPIDPRHAIDGLLTGYSPPSGPSADVGVRFTLPSGIVAAAELSKPTNHFIGYHPPRLSQVQPIFKDDSQTPPVVLKGGDQLSIQAPWNIFSTASPSFSGATWQLKNGLTDLGASTGGSALGDLVDNTFNEEFGPSGSNSSVPLTRADFSGWGESVFSDWSDSTIVTTATSAVSKANFEVSVGRTAKEVVQVVGEIIPCAARVVCTTTIQRLNSGVLLRRTEWKSISDGFYKFMNPAITTHPGVIKGVRNLVNIHDTGERVPIGAGFIFAGVRYDCSVVVENCVLGQSGAGVPCSGLLGYVKIKSPTANTNFSPADYDELISKVGSKMTASIDCTTDIGRSGQLMHISHFGPASVRNASSQIEFVMVASGSLILKSGPGAQWSFVRQGSTDASPQAVDSVAGVPLIQVGPVSSANPPIQPSSTAQPYKFADGVDLYVDDTTPTVEYSLVHATGSQRVAFRRPKIEIDDQHHITSVVPALLADMFSLGTSTGPFPSQQTCLELKEPDGHDYYLQISAGGNLTLHLDPITVGVNGSTRVMAANTNYTNTVRASRQMESWMDEQLEPTTIDLAIDTTSPTAPWALSVTNLTISNSIQGSGEMSILLASISSSPAAATTLTNTKLIWGPGMQFLRDVILFFKNLGILVAFNVHVTNDWSYQATAGFDLPELLEMLGLAAGPALSEIVDELSFHAGIEGDFKGNTGAVMEIDATIKIPTGAGPTLSGILKFTSSFSSEGNSMELDAGGGLGFAFDLVGLSCEGYFAIMMNYTFGASTGLGGSFIIKAGAEILEWLKITISLELKAAIINSPCKEDQKKSTIYQWGQATIAVEISLFAFVDIDFQVSGEVDMPMEKPAECPLIHA
ncbi:hypothetical protein GP486_001835 [Trichoglossum hirsutum]|uniref:Uncharacterized protein n=1 Tax=Trichoglossum hirsutum TaxID=265104 RepID=A0A9P8RS91_9PEZI|nr:hypothetical protein GP486_001835 [Trichoglossum hirsutum]